MQINLAEMYGSLWSWLLVVVYGKYFLKAVKQVYDTSQTEQDKVYYFQKNVFRGLISEGNEFGVLRVRSSTSLKLCYKRNFH